jgi:hypothetical protein
MAKRMSKEERGIRLITAAGLMVVMAWVFLPGTRVWIGTIGGVVLVAGIAAVVFAVRKGRQPSGNPTISHPSFFPCEKRSLTPTPAPPVATKLDAANLTREMVLAALRPLDWFQFEKVVAAIYRSYGDSVERLGGAHPDGGVDLIVTANTGRFVVQCKHWCNWTVGVKNIRELLGTLTTSGIPKGVFVTMRGYSDEARDLGVKHGLVLLDEKQLAELIVGLGPTHGAEVLALLNDQRKFCPKCENEMVLRTAKRGAKAGKQFWGCPNYPRCDGTLAAQE